MLAVKSMEGEMRERGRKAGKLKDQSVRPNVQTAGVPREQRNQWRRVKINQTIPDPQGLSCQREEQPVGESTAAEADSHPGQPQGLRAGHAELKGTATQASLGDSGQSTQSIPEAPLQRREPDPSQGSVVRMFPTAQGQHGKLEDRSRLPGSERVSLRSAGVDQPRCHGA